MGSSASWMLQPSPHLGLLPCGIPQMSRGPYPGREDDGGDNEDYTELLRAAYEKLEPDLRSRKALLVNKRVGSKVCAKHCTRVTVKLCRLQ